MAYLVADSLHGPLSYLLTVNMNVWLYLLMQLRRLTVSGASEFSRIRILPIKDFTRDRTQPKSAVRVAVGTRGHCGRDAPVVTIVTTALAVSVKHAETAVGKIPSES